MTFSLFALSSRFSHAWLPRQEAQFRFDPYAGKTVIQYVAGDCHPRETYCKSR